MPDARLVRQQRLSYLRETRYSKMQAAQVLEKGLRRLASDGCESPPPKASKGGEGLAPKAGKATA